MTMQQLKFHLSGESEQLATLDRFPVLEPGEFIALDTEHRGLGPGSPVVGVSLATAGAEWYLPCGHPEGRQYQPEQIRDFLNDNLAGREVFLRAAKNDIERLREFGVDLEAIGVIPHEIQHAAALLDDSRRKFDLDTLALDRLGKNKVIPLLSGRVIPRAEIPDVPAHTAAPYAKGDARLTYDLATVYDGDIAEQDLRRVVDLEDSLIYCVLAMERAKVKIDVPKLERWINEVREAHSARVLEIYRRTGLRINPDSAHDMAKLFKYLNIGYSRGRNGIPLFPEVYLKQYDEVKEVQCCIDCRDLSSLLSKYLVKYLNALTPDGYLPYQLHQLRADDYGTITGRFASSKVNIQQVYKPSKQKVQSPVTAPWLVRELFIAGGHEDFLMRFTVHDEVNGDLMGRWFHADASQIEYRLFAHFSSIPRPYSKRLIEAYAKDPNISFHKYVHKELLKECMIYDHAKNFNFMKLYGGGVDKAAAMLGTDDIDYVQTLMDQYDAKVPEAKRLLYYVSELAEKRGYVRTILGRRRRYHAGDRFYSGLNSVLQGSAADLMKLKLLRLYNERKNLKTFKDLEECFAVQEFKLRVPITWECSVGDNWKETS